MRRPKTAIIPPEYFASGDIGEQTADHDEYFKPGNEKTLRILVGYFVDRLNEPQKTSVQMCIMEGFSYAEAAKQISVERGRKTDPKTVWRWAHQGVQDLARMFDAAKWAPAIEPRLPEGPDDV